MRLIRHMHPAHETRCPIRLCSSCNMKALSIHRAALPLGAVALVFTVLVNGCSSIAIAIAPSKKATHDESAQTAQADAEFWSALHAGRYDDIGRVLEPLQAAYLAHPEDPTLAAHIAFLHVWRLAERRRSPLQRATITDDVILARPYFQEAVSLAPHDP